MSETNVRWLARLSLGACLVSGSVACDGVKRETLDRVTPHDSTTWTSRSDCEELLAKRTPESRPPRVGSWNVRFFPDSVEGEQTDADKATDVPWVACAIASLDVDVLAVQEFKNSKLALEKQRELLDRLNELTGGDWQLELDQCTPVELQHPGFLFDGSRVHGQAFREIPSMNPDPVCSNEISPGFAGYFSIDGGPDFHMVAVHGATGSIAEQMAKREEIAAALESVSNDAFGIDPDTDILFAGDFNSVGCESCDPVVSNEEENDHLAETVAGFQPSLTLLPASEACTRVASDMPHIDHVLVAADMAEVPKGSKIHVSGICEAIACDRQVNWLEDAYDHLSDHCPLLLDLAPLDDD